MKIKRYDFSCKPLQIQRSISVVGSAPGKQHFDGDTGQFSPDYTLASSNLQILPIISVVDADEIIASGNIANLLTNIAWYEIVDGVRTLIESTNTNYTITTTGSEAGKITVKKNVMPRHPLTLEFHAQFVDPRNNQVNNIDYLTYTIYCSSSTANPDLILDAADQSIYNPLKDSATQTVHAKLMVGASECATANRIFVWEVLREDGTWSAVDAEPCLDYHLNVAADSASITIDKSLMGESTHIRCRAKYDPDGNPSAVTLNDGCPQKVVAFIRRIPKYEYDMFDCPVNLPFGQVEFAPRAEIWDTNGIISDPEGILLPIWYMQTNTASGNLATGTSLAQVATGKQPILSTSKLSKSYGAQIGLDVVDRGPLAAWEDADGKLLEDASGNLILFR